MEKRVVVFLVLSLIIIFAYDFVMKELGLIPSQDAVLEDGYEVETTDIGKGNQQPVPEQTDAEGGQQAVSSIELEENGYSTQEQIEHVETPLIQVTISNRGGQIQSWKLKRYLTQNEESPHAIDLVYPEGHFPGPLSLNLSDSELTKLLREGFYEVNRDFTVLDADHPDGHLTFTYQLPDRNIRIQKELTFHHDSYAVDVEVKAEGLEEEIDVLLGTNFGVVEWGQGFIGFLGPAWMIGDELEKEEPDPELHRSGDIRWAALQDKYFISVIIPKGEIEEISAKKEAEYVMSASVRFPKASGTQHHAFQLYAGPKQFDILKSYGRGLEDTIDFGWFIYGSWGVVKAVAKPLFYVLRFLYDYTHNYGIAIILLTVGIKLLFVPLQYKSYTSMQGMQKIQPKVVALQNKFKDDREKLNKELMKLYREHKVNPVGGCLPMLVQMPAFISLFNILYMTVDLRQAPFMLWISDLSVQDPYYVLPVLMGVSMVVQQKIMPTTMDPTQAKMMLMLPVFMTFLFVTFPAGLVLYWLTNNVLTITQQFVTDRFIFKRSTFSQAPLATNEEQTESQETEHTSSKKKKAKGKGGKKDSEEM